MSKKRCDLKVGGLIYFLFRRLRSIYRLKYRALLLQPEVAMEIETQASRTSIETHSQALLILDLFNSRTRPGLPQPRAPSHPPPTSSHLHQYANSAPTCSPARKLGCRGTARSYPPGSTPSSRAESTNKRSRSCGFLESAMGFRGLQGGSLREVADDEDDVKPPPDGRDRNRSHL